MTHLYLIRHGEAVCNVNPIIGGMRGDTGLTPRGIKQAESLRERLATTQDIQADVLIASTLPRAQQTAEIIAPAFNIPIEWDDDVQEIRVGEADGLSYQESRTRFRGFDPSFDLYRPIAPGGESWAEFMLRVGRAIQRIITQHDGKTIVIVTHGGFIDGSFAYFLHMNTRIPARLEFYPHNTAITHWEQYTHSNQTYWRLASYNDVIHLHNIGVRESPRWSNVDANDTNDACADSRTA